MGQNKDVGVLSEDLKQACIRALDLDRKACAEYAKVFSWEASALQFLHHLEPTQP